MFVYYSVPLAIESYITCFSNKAETLHFREFSEDIVLKENDEKSFAGPSAMFSCGNIRNLQGCYTKYNTIDFDSF